MCVLASDGLFLIDLAVMITPQLAMCQTHLLIVFMDVSLVCMFLYMHRYVLHDRAYGL